MPANINALKKELAREQKENAHQEPQVKVPESQKPEQPLVEKPIESAVVTETVKPEIKQPESAAPAVEVKTESKPQEQDQLTKLFQELGIKSIDEIKELKRKAEREPEVIVQKTADQIEAEAVEYGISNGKLTLDEYTKRKEQAKKADQEILLNDFAEKLKAKNKSITQEQIQDKFNRKYGEEIVDGDAVRVIYDDDEIASEAKRVRENLLNPIMNVKNEYEVKSKNDSAAKSVERDYNRIKNEIPDSINLKVGDEDFQYHIDDQFKADLEQKFKESYVGFRKLQFQQGITTDEGLDVKAAFANLVVQNYLPNIMATYKSQIQTETTLDKLKPFENKMTQPLETAQATKKDFNETEELAKIKRVRRGY